MQHHANVSQFHLEDLLCSLPELHHASSPTELTFGVRQCWLDTCGLPRSCSSVSTVGFTPSCALHAM